MLFHVIGIKEAQNRKYNLDIVIDWDSDVFVRKFLQRYNIIVLNLSKYTKQSSDFGSMQIEISYKESVVHVFSYITDIKSALLFFMTVWFDIKYINFINENKIADTEVQNMISNTRSEIEQEKQQYKKDITQKKEQEKQIYRDQRLDKTRKIIDQVFVQIDNLLQKVWHRVSDDKIKSIKQMQQDLTKLKMWRNEDKMSELLQKIYEKIEDIDIEYLTYMQKNISYPIQDSIVTNIDIISENQKLKKAKKIKELGSQKSATDLYYLSFDYLGVYIVLMYKDLKNIIKLFPQFIKKIFNYTTISLLLMIIATSLILWSNKISYNTSINLYYDVWLIKIALFGLALYFVKFIKKDTVVSNILYLLLAIIISFTVFWLLKINFVF